MKQHPKKVTCIAFAGLIIASLCYLLSMLALDHMQTLNELAKVKRELTLEQHYNIGMQMQFMQELRNRHDPLINRECGVQL